MPDHPIFGDIGRGDLEAVKQLVLANPAVLEEKQSYSSWQMTPLIYAIQGNNPLIAHWLIDDRGQHDVNTRDHYRMTALHYACRTGLLSVVQALVTSGADMAVTNSILTTRLMFASSYGHSDIVAYLLQLPAVRATANAVDQGGWTALSYASSESAATSVQLLLDAGADPTIPAGDESPLNRALSQEHDDIAALLRAAIAEPTAPAPSTRPALSSMPLTSSARPSRTHATTATRPQRSSRRPSPPPPSTSRPGCSETRRCPGSSSLHTRAMTSGCGRRWRLWWGGRRGAWSMRGCLGSCKGSCWGT